MGWASGYIEQLKRGETVAFRPRGHSMSSKIESRHLCTGAPVDPATLTVGASSIYGRLLRVEP